MKIPFLRHPEEKVVEKIPPCLGRKKKCCDGCEDCNLSDNKDELLNLKICGYYKADKGGN